MTTITDFSNELHVRLYVAELLKNNVKDKDFEDQAERMVSFIVRKSKLPVQPRIPESSGDMFSNWYKILAGISGCPSNNQTYMTEIERSFYKYKSREVRDPKSDKTGIIVGFSKDFDSLIASCDPGHKGIEPCDNDSIMIDRNLIMQGVFYISVEEVKKQIES